MIQNGVGDGTMDMRGRNEIYRNKKAVESATVLNHFIVSL